MAVAGIGRGFVLTGMLALAGALASPAAAQSFKDKTVTILVGSSTGGGLDTFARLTQRHLGKHLAGNPSVVVTNMPGAGGAVVAQNLYRKSAPDGLTMAITFPSVIIDPLLNEELRREYDPTKFIYVGNANAEVLVCMLRNEVQLGSLEDFRSREFVIGATAPGSTTADFPHMANGLLGTKFKLVTGYKGSRDVTLAMERNEVQGICGLGWSTVKVQYPDILTGTTFARVVAQEDLKGHPDLHAKGVPMMMSLARNDEENQALEMFYSQNAFSRTFILPPNVPADRVKAQRDAFMATMADAELLSDAQRMNVDVGPSTGEDVQALVARMYQLPPSVVSRVRHAMGRT
ncbi:MAG TPA: tripartite tricarboxylate transporter substrate-binding protein [Alphaproteobacteria bacterium]|nr:tripartite tricarboxylate transporter substrate-binding protein [Alphaproteobacteria bacterium]